MPSKPYAGAERKLVLAFDVGTTYSGVSYSILEPGEVPEIHSVTRFPGQEVAGNSKIPTVLYYDGQGQARAFGAEAVEANVLNEAINEGWHKCEWFKLYLCPKRLAPNISDNTLPPLPPGKTVVDVFGDFLRYLHQCARDFIRDTYAGGADLWNSLEGTSHFVLSHPNGWRGLQQSQMRCAAISAGLISNDRDSRPRLKFVSEGEACLHFCLESGFVADLIESGQGVLIIDAGGGTIDLSAYRKNVTDNAFEEIAQADCLLRGSTYVTRKAKQLLQVKLEGCLRYGTPEQINDIAECFDKTTKRLFRSREALCFIKFGARYDRDPQFDINHGQLKLRGDEVATLFEPSIRATIQAIDKQLREAQTPVAAVLLVGGFAASQWLFSNLRDYVEGRGLQFLRPDGQVNKVVANGAVSFHLEGRVTARISTLHYGLQCCLPFDLTNPEHVARAHRAKRSAPGAKLFSDYFRGIVHKGDSVAETKEFTRSFFRKTRHRSHLYTLSEDIVYYVGSSENPEWIDDEPSAFLTLCTVKADTSALAKTLSPQFGPCGEYYTLNFKVILRFGLTELEAQFSWIDDGTERRSDATIVYEDDETSTLPEISELD